MSEQNMYFFVFPTMRKYLYVFPSKINSLTLSPEVAEQYLLLLVFVFLLFKLDLLVSETQEHEIDTTLMQDKLEIKY